MQDDAARAKARFRLRRMQELYECKTSSGGPPDPAFLVAYEALPTLERSILTDFYFTNLDADEICAKYEMSDSELRSLKAAAKKRLLALSPPSPRPVREEQPTFARRATAQLQLLASAVLRVIS